MMDYISTRDMEKRFTAAQSIALGLARDGGLLTPASLPRLSEEALALLEGMDYPRRAAYIMGLFLEEFSQEELEGYARAAYGPEKFDTPQVAPVREVDGNTCCLELWHGPTCAFKDLALQMLPHLLTASLRKLSDARTACILVATSGDTGKGALEGFRDVAGTKILVFYPKDGVSQVQELQMLTQEGENVGVCAVRGNFDDAQTGVKAMFSDPALREELSRRGYFFSSANSINWGRVLPQIVYYISACCDLRRRGALKPGEKLNVCVPTGNFGDILAGYYARQMGAPIARLICASNRNCVLTDFIRQGVYDRKREFYHTISPSMDILISSNLERLLLDVTGSDQQVRSYMSLLEREGAYRLRPEDREKVQALFSGYYCDDAATKETIGRIYRQHRYLVDTHSAVGFHALEQYRRETGDEKLCLVVSTASPFKFCGSVLEALGQEEPREGLDSLDQLSALTGLPIPTPLASLRGKPPRFQQVVEKTEMPRVVLELLV